MNFFICKLKKTCKFVTRKTNKLKLKTNKVQIKKILHQVASERKSLLPMMVFFSITNAIWSSSILFLITHKISGKKLPFLDDYDWLIFLSTAIFSYLITYYFKRYILKLTLEYVNQITLQIIDKLRKSNYEIFLKFSEAKARTLINDVAVLKNLPFTLTLFVSSAITVVAALGYLFWLYPKGTVIILVLVFSLFFVFSLREKMVEKDMNAGRDLEDDFMEIYNDLLQGFNKIKMSTKRNDTLNFEYIVKNRNKSFLLNYKSVLASFVNDLLGTYSFYLLIAVILYVLPKFFSVQQSEIPGFITALMFLIAPIGAIMGQMKTITESKIAFKKIEEFDEFFLQNSIETKFKEYDSNTEEFSCFDELNFQSVSFNHTNENGEITFQLKTIDLKIGKGEVIFISGGNGSGKSTFINILAGLYIQKSGEIYFNEELITNKNRQTYRNKISFIFSEDYHFSRNYNAFDLKNTNPKLMFLLKEMKLDKVMNFDNNNELVIHKLSSGQQKRLALIFSILEDKEIFIFDEWAAEQDPEFRRYFYTSIIPSLKNKGKTIIAITHDDAYFKYCDRLLKFDYGQIVSEEKLQPTTSFELLEI